MLPRAFFAALFLTCLAARAHAAIDWSVWQLQEPDGATISTSQLQSAYSDAYFYVAGDGGQVFMDPATGTTTSGSLHPRTELREMTAGAAAAWAPTGTNTLTVSGTVLQLGGGSGGKTTLGQVFNGTLSIPLCEFIYSASLGGFEILYEEAKGGGSYINLGTPVALNTPYTFSLSLSNNVLTVTVNGVVVYTYSPSAAVLADSFYFKAGNYDQTAVAGANSTVPYTVIEDSSIVVYHGSGPASPTATESPGALFSPTPTRTASAMPTSSVTPTRTATLASASATPSRTPSATPTPSITGTPSPGPLSPSASATPSPASVSPTPSPTGTLSPGPPSPSPSTSATWSPTPTASATLSPTPTLGAGSPTSTVTATATPTSTTTATASPTASAGSTATETPSASPGGTAIPTVTPSAAATASATPTVTGTASPSPSASPSTSQTASATPTATPTSTPTAGSTLTATSLPSATPTAGSAATATPPGGGELTILASFPVPNPNPDSVEIQLAGSAEAVQLSLWSSAMVRVLQTSSGACGPGWCRLPLPESYAALPRGLYFYEVQALRGAQRSLQRRGIMVKLR